MKGRPEFTDSPKMASGWVPVFLVEGSTMPVVTFSASTKHFNASEGQWKSRHRHDFTHSGELRWGPSSSRALPAREPLHARPRVAKCMTAPPAHQSRGSYAVRDFLGHKALTWFELPEHGRSLVWYAADEPGGLSISLCHFEGPGQTMVGSV